MKTRNKKKPKKNLKALVIPAIITLQFAAIAGLLMHSLYLKHKVAQFEPAAISRLIIEAVDSIGHDVNYEAQTGKIYFHESRLVLPATEESSLKLRYYSNPAADGTPAELRLIDETAVRPAKSKVISAASLDELFEAVPKFQSCSRGYLLSFKELKDPGGSHVFSKLLKDGRTIYVYMEELCNDNSVTMIPYLNQIDSY